MAEPTQKAEGIESLIKAITGKDRREEIRANRCTWCGGDASQFRDKLSEEEYKISGFCMKCQDETFGK